jgi:ribosomal protein S27AE
VTYDPDLGGDPVCWLDRVCPECGAFRDEPSAPCPRCGAPGVVPEEA